MYGATIWVHTKDHWINYVAAFAQVLAAFGTLAAVLVALRGVRRLEQRTLGIRVDIFSGQSRAPGLFLVTITNEGGRAVKITEIFFRDANWRVFAAHLDYERYALVPEQGDAAELPVTLLEGESQQWWFRSSDPRQLASKPAFVDVYDVAGRVFVAYTDGRLHKVTGSMRKPPVAARPGPADEVRR